jgi:signal transduction histidine kinase/CheY-like chemotaxis protein
MVHAMSARKENIQTWAAWVLFGTCLLLTGAGALFIKNDVEASARKGFDFSCTEIKNIISERLRSNARILRGGSAFFEGSDSITRKEWKNFIATQNIAKYLPGIQGVGYIVLLHPGELPGHERWIRKEGFTRYRVAPEGMRDVYTAIMYLEPFNSENACALGYDLFTDPISRAAMEHARDYDAATLSGKVTLIQDAGPAPQPATLMFVPVYGKTLPHETREQRRAAIRGWVFSPHRMNDLMKAVIGNWETNEWNRVRLEISDDSSFTEKNVLYDSREAGTERHRGTPIFTARTIITFNYHKWFVRFTQDDVRSASIDYAKVWMVAIGGTLVSVLLFIIFLTLIHTNARIHLRAEELTEHLRESEQILRDVQRRESIGVLSSGIAHDFNNLLGAMMGNISIAQTRLPSDHPAASNLTKAQSAIDRAAQLTSQMLAYSGKGKVRNCVIDAAATIQEHIEFFEVSIAKNVRLDTHLPATPIYVKGDPSQFEQIVMNLITNGSEALEERHGIVSIRLSAVTMSTAELVPYGRLLGSVLKPGEYAVLEVSDNGIGMSTEMQKKIFDPFFTTKFLGRGLGLSAVLGIIRGHEGGIAIESAVGAGTTFRVLLPTQPAPPHSSAPAPRAATTTSEPIKTTVLVIDDELEVASATGEMLETADYRSVIEIDPRRGIEVYKRLHAEIGLVLLDLTMPELTGREVAVALEAIDPEVKIIISSGYSEDEGSKQMGDTKYSGFIQKPYTLQSLAAIVGSVLA